LKRTKLAAAAVLALSCQQPSQRAQLRLELPAELASRGGELRVLPAIAEARRAPGQGVVALELKPQAGKVVLELPGACPITLDTRQLTTHTLTTLAFEPLFDVGPRERIVGLDQSFTLRAEPRCAAARRLRGSWHVTGAALRDVVQDGRHFSARTAAALPDAPRAHGIVPVSARVQEQLRAQLLWRFRLSGRPFEQGVSLAAVARSTGLPNVGLTHPLLLSNDGWRLFDQPLGSNARLRPTAGGLSELLPDIPGKYRLSDAAGVELSIQSGRFDRVPLDCGRADCHVAIAESVQRSPMTQALASDLGGCHSLSDPTCAIACHTTGEPGTNDGGFSHVATELGISTLPLEHDDLPRALRRLGGVGCLACHGPAAIPEPSARLAILRSDVCAVCHDAPPRYNHVQALRASRMGHADHDPRTRSGPCARCHTSWGALGRATPAGIEQLPGFGLTCSTCHDVHPRPHPDAVSKAIHGGLLRDFAQPAWLQSPPAAFAGVSRVCISCHSPSSATEWPEASAAALVAGQGGLEPQTNDVLSMAPIHATEPKGCLTCHSDTAASGLGQGHDFRARPRACEKCHTEPPPREPALGERARALFARLAPPLSDSPSGPWHARGAPPPRDSESARALRNVLLVLEDPAADVHHPRYAKALLDAAERAAAQAER
jgi:hypothetical protein